jgi:hypothetical protein
MITWFDYQTCSRLCCPPTRRSFLEEDSELKAQRFPDVLPKTTLPTRHLDQHANPHDLLPETNAEAQRLRALPETFENLRLFHLAPNEGERNRAQNVLQERIEEVLVTIWRHNFSAYQAIEIRKNHSRHLCG